MVIKPEDLASLLDKLKLDFDSLGLPERFRPPPVHKPVVNSSPDKASVVSKDSKVTKKTAEKVPKDSKVGESTVKRKNTDSYDPVARRKETLAKHQERLSHVVKRLKSNKSSRVDRTLPLADDLPTDANFAFLSDYSLVDITSRSEEELLSLNKNYKNRTNVRFELNGLPVKFLVDTGASVTAISEKMYKSLPLIPPLNPASMNIRDASHNRLTVLGTAMLTLDTPEQTFEHSVAVIRNLSPAAILGHDFMRKHNGKPDPTNNTLVLNGETLDDNLVATLRVPDDVIIPPRHEIFIRTKPSQEMRDYYMKHLDEQVNSLLVEGNKRLLTDECLLVANSITCVHCSGCDGVTVKVLNALDQPAVLSKGAVIASLQEVDSITFTGDHETLHPELGSEEINALSTERTLKPGEYVSPENDWPEGEIIDPATGRVATRREGSIQSRDHSFTRGGLPAGTGSSLSGCGRGDHPEESCNWELQPSAGMQPTPDCPETKGRLGVDSRSAVPLGAGSESRAEPLGVAAGVMLSLESGVTHGGRILGVSLAPSGGALRKSGGVEGDTPRAADQADSKLGAGVSDMNGSSDMAPPMCSQTRKRMLEGSYDPKTAQKVKEAEELLDGIPRYLSELVKDSQVDVKKAEKTDVREFLLKNRDIFARGKWDLGESPTPVNHMIKLSDDVPVKERLRRLSPVQTEECRTIVESMLQQGVVRESISDYSSPIVMVKKKDGSIRLCVDYRSLNDKTIKNRYPLPLISSLLDDLGSMEYYATLDLQSGYWQVPIAECDRHKTAFITPFGLYEFNVVPFGLTNAPAVFQQIMNAVLRGLDPRTVMCYLDDIVVAGKSVSDLMDKLGQVFQRFREHGLKFGPNKCKLFKREIQFLGHIVSNKGIRMDPEKLKGIRDFETPKNRKQVQSFLGTCNYYRRFIRNFSHIAFPLSCLTSPYVKFTWTEFENNSFLALKKAILDAPILTFPHSHGLFILDTDASDYGVGAVLSQVLPGGPNNSLLIEMPISFFSKTLDKFGRNYCITRKELLAAVLGVKNFKPYLWGRPFIIRTDHSALEHMLKTSSANTDPVVVRMLEILSPYEFKVIYRKGESHGNADGCSRGVHDTMDCKFCSKHLHNCPTCDQVNGEFEEDYFNPTYATPAELLTKTMKNILRRGYDEELYKKLVANPDKLKSATEDWLRENRHVLDKLEGKKPESDKVTLSVLDKALSDEVMRQVKDIDRHWINSFDGYVHDYEHEHCLSLQEQALDLHTVCSLSEQVRALSFVVDSRFNPEQIKALQKLDPDLKLIYQYKSEGKSYEDIRTLNKTGLSETAQTLLAEYDRVTLEKGILFYMRLPKGEFAKAVRVPAMIIPAGLKEQVLKYCHEGPGSTHPRLYKFLQILSRDFYWVNMERDARLYVDSCLNCQKRMKRGDGKTGLRPISPFRAGHLMQQVHLDLVGPL